jgi:hypothetical protein
MFLIVIDRPEDIRARKLYREKLEAEFERQGAAFIQAYLAGAFGGRPQWLLKLCRAIDLQSPYVAAAWKALERLGHDPLQADPEWTTALRKIAREVQHEVWPKTAQSPD